MAQTSLARVFLLLYATFVTGQTVSSPAPSPLPSELLRQGLDAYHTGNFDVAIEKYQGVLKEDAHSGDAYAGLARTYLKQDKVDLAFDTASKGVAQAPGSLPAHTALGEVYFRQAKMVESEKEFLNGVNARDPDARACLGLSRLYSAYSLHAKARKMLERANSLDPGDPEIRRRWIRTLKRQQQIEWLQKYLSAPTNDDADTIHSLHTYLDFLTERAKRPQSNCRLVSRVSSTEAELKRLLTDPKHLHGYGLSVKINGQPSTLLLDTGASGLLINKKLAQKAGIEPLVTTKVAGIGDKGDMGGYIGLASSIKIGDLEFQNCVVDVSDKRSIVDDDGLIGADVFSHYLVTIAFVGEKLKLEELPARPGEKVAQATLASQQEEESEDNDSQSQGNEKPRDDSAANAKAPSPPAATASAGGPQDRYIAPEMQSYTKIFMAGHDLLIPTRVGNSPPKLFLIDTGAMMNAISPQAAHEVTKVRGDSDMEVRGISGAVRDVYSADKAVLQFSHYRQENQDMTSFDLSRISRSDGMEVSGILGFTTLRFFTLKIDYRDGLVDFVYAGPKQ